MKSPNARLVAAPVAAIDREFISVGAGFKESKARSLVFRRLEFLFWFPPQHRTACKARRVAYRGEPFFLLSPETSVRPTLRFPA